MVWDCLWNREEHNDGDINPVVPGDIDKDKLNKGWSMDRYWILSATCLYCVPLGIRLLRASMFFFSKNRPLGQFLLVVAKSVHVSVCLCVCLSPFMRFSQGSKGGPRGAKPVRLLKQHVHHLQFPDKKAKQSQSVSSKSTSITCNFLIKKCNSMRFSQGSKASLSPRRARPSPAISWWKKQSKASLSPRRARPSPAISWWKNVIVSVLLSALVERFFVSRMRDFSISLLGLFCY